MGFRGRTGSPWIRAAALGALIGLAGYGAVAANVGGRGQTPEELRQRIFEERLAELVEAVGETVSVVDRDGNEVGYIRAEDMLWDLFETPSDLAEGRATGEPEGLPVWSHDSNALVGFMIADVGFVPLSALEPAAQIPDQAADHRGG